MKIIVIGGDGFCGWPISLKLSIENYDVTIIDNFSRRQIDSKLNINSLCDIESLHTRLNIWKQTTHKTINFHNIDVAKEFDKLQHIIREINPSVIIHLGEQRSAPYSMKSNETSSYTVFNNLIGTHNILRAIISVNKNIHLIHIGTMGVYGYGTISNITIPEGYIDVKIKNNQDKDVNTTILHPFYPGSIYHLTKAQDSLYFQFYNKNYGIKITDLHQGIIWGSDTPETLLHPKLKNRIDYDSDYGTVLNRFIMQSVNDIPLTIYGSGEQTRAFINIEDTTNCILLAVKNTPDNTKVKIINQMTQTFSVIQLATLIKEIYPNTKLNFIDNPRKELSKNSLDVNNNTFLNLGLNPILLDRNKIIETYNLFLKYKNNYKLSSVLPCSFW